MDLMEKIYQQAKENPQIVAFPEADDPKMLQAVNEAVSGGYCKPLLVGDPEAIRQAAQEAGVDVSGMEIFDNNDADKKTVSRLCTPRAASKLRGSQTANWPYRLQH